MIFHENRRRQPRWEASREIKVVCHKGSQGDNLTLAVINLSQTGICLALSAPLSEGQEVTMTLESLGNRLQLRLLGNVVWCQAVGKKWVTGIHFLTGIDHADFIGFTQGVSPPP